MRAPPGGVSSLCLSWADDPGKLCSRMDSSKYSQMHNAGSHTGQRPLIRTDDESDPGRSFAQAPFSYRSREVGRVPDRFYSVASEATMEPLPLFAGADASCIDGASYTESACMYKAGFDAWGVGPASMRKSASGYPRESSNRFASNAQQNRGNFITETRTTYVSAPPGGASSICLGSSAADPAFERSSLTLLKKRMSKRSPVSVAEMQPDQSVADSGFAPLELQSKTGIESSAAGGRWSGPLYSARGDKAAISAQFGDSASRFPNFAHESSIDITSGRDTYAADRGRWKQAEVEGSRPKVWRPAVMPRAPPGGIETYKIDASSDLQSAGKKRFPDGCAGNNPDLQAVEALRFYQHPDQRLGKQHLATDRRPHAEQKARDSHRYHLDGVGDSHGVIGKARVSEAARHRSSKLLLAWEADTPAVGCKANKRHLPSSQSTCVGSSESSMQEFRNGSSETWDQHFWSQPPVHEENEEDDLPLGAEWCTFYDESGAAPS